MSIRQFKRGGELLLDALSTFTATELISYNDFVAYTIIANVLTLKRVDLKKKVSFVPAAAYGQQELTSSRSSSHLPKSHRFFPNCQH